MSASTGPPEATDQLMLHVRELFSRIDPTPADLADRIKFAITVQALHAEVAELVAEQPLAVRGEPEPSPVTTVTFSTADVSIMVTISAESTTTARLDGYLSLGSGTVQLTDSGGTARASADDTGRFVFHDVARGSARLLVHRGEARPVITPAFMV